MPNLTTTIEDSSPVIIYSNGWEIGSSTSDDFVERYSESSYMRTNVTQASASFTFYGNGVQIFGAKRQNYSRYQVSIDSKVYPIRDASVSDPLGSFQTSLFSTIALAVGDHTVHLTNIDQKPLDLDFITWQTPVGQDSDTITVVTDQDTESSFDYSPSSQWSTDVPNPGMFSGGSGHVTYTAGATVRFTFKVRSAVQLFGPVGPNCAPYSVSLDDGTPLNYSSYRPFYRPEQLLFQASNLGAQEHNIAVRSQTGTNSTVYFAVDYVQVFTPSSWDRSSGLSVAQIVGIVVGSVSGLILLVALVFLLRSKRGKYSLLRKKKDEVEHEQGPSLVIEPFSDFHSPLPVSPLYDTQAFTPRNSKGQLSNRTMVQSTKTTFSGENLYLQPENPSPMSSSSQRTPRILDEKRRLEPPLDTARESMPEMVQSPLPAVISVPTIEESPPVYLK